MDEQARVGVFVDGPNVFREEFDVDLDEIRDTADTEGRLAVKRLYVDEGAPPELIRAAEARGFEVTVTSGDVDVKLAVDMTEFVATGQLDTVVVVSRDTDFKPAVEVANRHGLRTVALAPGEHGRSDALANAAHAHVTLGRTE
ncbi:NYN domain-containing protein [Halosegnis longus]|uniref:NYN domain-containing protein n=1 Tax=Halosegnis longus TaxID=2216012 RepID=A0AAJ4R9H2_9EURY|nr:MULTISPECIES: NYN domain-containing protein [Halobacteriales]RNJ26819.1 NYN domain-containing protein [Salella cibi]